MTIYCQRDFSTSSMLTKMYSYVFNGFRGILVTPTLDLLNILIEEEKNGNQYSKKKRNYMNAMINCSFEFSTCERRMANT